MLIHLRKSIIVRAVAVAAIVLAITLPGGIIDARQGPPDLEALHKKMLPLFEMQGIVFTDADERFDRLVVGVENRGLARSVEARLSALGIPLELVDIVETEPIVQLASLRDRHRPLLGGTQIHFGSYLCTLGFNAEREGVQGFVTNSHCTNVQGGVESTQYYQPLSSVDSTVVGTETVDPRYANCGGGFVCRYSDSAFVRRSNNVSGEMGSIAKTTGPNNGSLTVDGKFTIVGKGTHGVGTTVNKVGRTTGWTQGSVSNTCVNTQVSGTRIVQLCQTFVSGGSSMVGPGDSGSPVFSIASGDNVQLQGILWGGSTSGDLFVFSPMANIELQSELGALSVTGSGSSPTPTPSPSATATPTSTPPPSSPTPTPTPPPGDGDPNKVHVADLDGSKANNGSTWTATVTITVKDGTGAAVSGAVVSGSWSGANGSTSTTCDTNGNGTCQVSASGIPKRTGSVAFTVANVSAGGKTYDSTANTDPDGDSNGTLIVVTKP